ncbi:hypothetical protein LCGC14_2183020 [marine sediment metagenome]|uniref:Uncharacterized protein n=1 Tax=marine sediment metagenome TaxID=412755 RepID=A0A0F9E8S2_9ZZZZ
MPESNTNKPSDAVLEAAAKRGATWKDGVWTYNAPATESDGSSDISKMSPEHQNIITRNKATLAELRSKKQSRAESTAAFLQRVGQQAPSYDQQLLTKLSQLGDTSPNTPNWTLLEQAVEELKDGE